MYVIFQGESILIPATVTGDKNAIENLVVQLKAANPGGGIPDHTDTVVATFEVADYTSAEVTDGYLFTLENTTTIAAGVYYVNYKYNVGDLLFKGTPKKITIREGLL